MDDECAEVAMMVLNGGVPLYDALEEVGVSIGEFAQFLYDEDFDAYWELFDDGAGDVF